MTTPSPKAYIDVVVHLDDRMQLPPMRLTLKDVGLIPMLVDAQVRTAVHVQTAITQALMELDEDVDG